MSFGLHVYCATTVPPNELLELITGIEGLRIDSIDAQPCANHEIQRAVRGSYAHMATLDGPMRVEREDLPDAVQRAAVGISTTYELNCPFTPAVGIRLTKQVARRIAEHGNGVVYDPQDDVVMWPRGGTRRFKATSEQLIDVVDLTWYIRREDRPDDLAAAVFDTIEALLPEALPRRFGSFEPLPFRLDSEGRAGFTREWQNEELMLFWKARLPCLSGHMSGLGGPPPMPDPPPHPVGSVHLGFHRHCLSEERWRRDIVALFCTMAERTNAFFALADVERNVGYRGGSLSYGRDAETPPGLVVRDRWLGLPPHEFWLAWIGPLYRDLLDETMADLSDVEKAGGSLFLRLGTEPPLPKPASKTPPRKRGLSGFFRRHRSDSDVDTTSQPEPRRVPLPADLVMKVRGREYLGHERERAQRVPDGL